MDNNRTPNSPNKDTIDARTGMNFPAVRNTGMPAPMEDNTYREDYRNIYRGYRKDMRNREKNVFRAERNYRQYESPQEIYETIISHMSKGTKFHDSMMDLYIFMGLDGFHKMHEYQYLCESMKRRQIKSYVIEHMNFLVKDECDEQDLSFISPTWYDYSRHVVTPEVKQQYIKPSFQAYWQWEQETKELLSYCANELMYMGEMAYFNEIMKMVDEIEEEIQMLEKLMIKLESVDFKMEYVLDIQEEICDFYTKKIHDYLEEEAEKGEYEQAYRRRYRTDESYRRDSRTGRYVSNR